MDHSKQQAKSVFRCRTRRLRGDSGGRKERKRQEGKGRIERRDSKIKAGNQRWKPVLVGLFGRFPVPESSVSSPQVRPFEGG